ncbi:MAG: AraC family transcriptional regulator [Acidobacteriota bacterium]
MSFALYQRVPSPALARFVDTIWLSQGAPPTHNKERVLPNGAAALIFNLAEDRITSYNRERPQISTHSNGALVAGPRAQFEVIDTECQRHLAGVVLRPAGAALLLGMPAYELTDLDVPLDTLWGRQATCIRERLMHARSPTAILAALERCLLERLPGAPPPLVITYALEQLHRATAAPPLAEVARITGYSQRRFIELFRHHTGIGPKTYQRIQRFQQALRLAHQGALISWTDLAVSTGYYDQAHFIHDFRAFSGITPTEYYLNRGLYATHVALPV